MFRNYLDYKCFGEIALIVFRENLYKYIYNIEDYEKIITYLKSMAMKNAIKDNQISSVIFVTLCE